MNQKSNMHVAGESDGRTVPTKCPNKSGKPLAEEGRRPTKENIEQTTASQRVNSRPYRDCGRGERATAPPMPMQWKQYQRGDGDPLVFLTRSALIPLLTDVRNNHRYFRDTSF